MNKRIVRKRLKFVCINSLFALSLFIWFQKVYFLPTDDADFFFYGPVLKNTLFKTKPDIEPKDFLFIDTQFDNVLIEKYEEGQLVNFPATDRKKLVQFFEKVKAFNAHKYIVCDIFFDYETEDDDRLSGLMKDIDRFIIPRKENLFFTSEKFRDINSGLINSYSIGGVFYKYSLFDRKTLSKSIPLKMYEELNNTKVETYGPFILFDGKIALNDFVPEPRFRNYTVLPRERSDFKQENKDEKEKFKYPVAYLGNILATIDKEPSFFKSTIEDRIIVIGNFKTDRIGTLYGVMPGSFIPLNTYLGLQNEENKISFSLLFALFIIFAAFSYFVITPKDKIKEILLNIPIIGGFTLGLGYVLFMSIFGILVYLIFGNNLNLTYIAILFYLQNLMFTKINFFNKIKRYINT